MVPVKTLDETSFNFVAPDVGAMTLENLEDFVNRVHRRAHRACWDVLRNSWGTERSYLQRDTKPKLRSAAWIQSEAARKLVCHGRVGCGQGQAVAVVVAV
jgi:hypothetical protein